MDWILESSEKWKEKNFVSEAVIQSAKFWVSGYSVVWTS